MPPSSPLSNVGGCRRSIYIAGLSATVSFAGAAPGVPGLYQLNVEVPFIETVPHRKFNTLVGFEYFDHTGRTHPCKLGLPRSVCGEVSETHGSPTVEPRSDRDFLRDFGDNRYGNRGVPEVLLMVS